MRTRLAAALRAIATLDLRALALYRIGIGTVVAIDSLLRIVDAQAFYTDDGVQPRGNVVHELTHSPSLYQLSGSLTFAIALLLVNAACGAAVAVGVWTRAFTIALWVLQVSVGNRCAAVNSGADSVVTATLLIAMFLPLGARFSIDARRRRTPADDGVCTWATGALVAQVLLIYVFNVLHKLPGDTWRNGTAVFQALHLDQHATPIGVWFLRHGARELSPALTYGTLFIESAVLLLLVSSPRLKDRARTALVAAMWSLHLGFALFMYLALFSPVCMAVWLAMLPAGAFTRAPLRWLARVSPRGLCHGPLGGTVDARRPDRREAMKRRAVGVVLGVLLLVQLGQNIESLVGVDAGPAKRIARPLRIGGTWRMFSPNPTRSDGWWVAPATLRNGDVVDVLADGGPVTEQKPDDVAARFKNGRWRKYLTNHGDDKTGKKLARYAQWLCRSWNQSHDDEHRAVKVSVVRMAETTPRSLRQPKAERRDLIVDRRCR